MAFDDHLKNKGPLLTSFNVGGSNVLSGEWVAKAGTQQFEQKVPLSFTINGNGTSPVKGSPLVTPTAILIDETLEQTLTDERKHTTLSLNAPDGSGPPPPGGGPPGSWTLVDEVRLPVGKVATRTRALVPEGSHLVLTDDMLQAEQRNLGIGLEQTVLTTPLPSAAVVDERLNEAAAIATTTKTRKLAVGIVVGESVVTHTPSSPLSGGALDPTSLPIEAYWIRVAREGETETVATEIRTVERLDQTATLTYRVEADGGLVTITKRHRQTSKIAKGETVNAAHNLWMKTHAEGESALVATEVIEFRLLPTPSVTSTKLEVDGTQTVVNKRKRHTADIISQEQLLEVRNQPNPPNHIIGYNWVKTYKEGESLVVATEVTEIRFFHYDPTNPSAHTDEIKSNTVNGEMQVVASTKKLKRTTDIVFGANIAANGFITTTEMQEVGADISEETVSGRFFTDKALYSRSTEIGLPAEYRSLVTVTNTENIVRGDGAFKAAMPALLANGELEKSEQQIDNLLKRKGLKVIDTAALVPTSVEELTTEYGGMLMDVIKTVAPIGDTSLNIDPVELTQYNVISDKVTSYGTFGIREKKVNQSNAFPLLYGNEVDATLNLVLPFTQDVVASSYRGSVSPGQSIEVKPLDSARSLRITRTSPTGVNLLTDFLMVFPSTTNVDFPPELVSIQWAGTTSAGAGSYGSDGSYTIYNGGSGAMSLRGRANGSAAAMLDIVPKIKQTHGQNISCHHYLFFMAGPTLYHGQVLARAATLSQHPGLVSWPTFKPESVQIVCKGRSIRGTAEIDKYDTDTFLVDYLGATQGHGNANSFGTGTSFDVEVTSKAVTIPPTIHGDLNVTAIGDPNEYFAGFTAQGRINTRYTPPASGTAVASFTPGNVTHTGGSHFKVPTSGQFITHMVVEPYKFGYFKCDVEIVDAQAWQ